MASSQSKPFLEGVDSRSLLLLAQFAALGRKDFASNFPPTPNDMIGLASPKTYSALSLKFAKDQHFSSSSSSSSGKNSKSQSNSQSRSKSRDQPIESAEIDLAMAKSSIPAGAGSLVDMSELADVDLDEKRVGSPSTPPQSFTKIQLETLDRNLFIARKEYLWKPSADGVVYGGQVIGQSLAAATKTVASIKILHSMHCYFLIGGQTDSDIVYTVLPLRDGGSFSSRLVIAQQRSTPIFIMISSFQKMEFSSLSHQAPMPLVLPPEKCLSAVDYYHFLMTKDPRCPENYRPGFKQRMEREQQSPIESRFVLVSDFLKQFGSFDDVKAKITGADDTLKMFPTYTSENRRLVWIRAKDRLPDDDADCHRAVLAYASDMFLLASAITGKFNLPQVGMIASRDHSMWFHSPFRMDEWMLYELESPRAESGRGLSFGRVFRQDGTLAVSVSQEGLIRLRQDMKQFKENKKDKKEKKKSSKL